MRRQTTARFLWMVGLGLLLTVGCGPDPDGGSGDVGDGGTGDASGLGDGGGDGDAHVCNDVCNSGDHRCNGDVLEVCATDQFGCKLWDVETDCTDNGQYCDDTNGTPTCVTPETCEDGIQNQDETDVDCGGLCNPCDVGSGCSDDDDCTSGACTNGTCVLCHAGTFHCFGNYLRVCADDESSWNDSQHCNPVNHEFCDQVNGTCTQATPIGVGPDGAQGVYYQFAYFTTDNSEFRGGNDVDCLQDHCFVNRDGQHVDEYEIELEDTDGDGLLEPNQHPDNPDNPGPIENRTITYIATYDIPLGGRAANELYVTADSIFYMNSQALWQWDRTSHQTTNIAPWLGSLGRNQVLGFDDVNGIWYTANRDRYVYSWDDVAAEWVLEFEYPNLSGSHNDGMEVVTDPNTGVPYVYVSDMTSDFIAQYTEDKNGRWVQLNLFQYYEEHADFASGICLSTL